MRQCIQEGIEQSKLLCGIRRIDDGKRKKVIPAKARHPTERNEN